MQTKGQWARAMIAIYKRSPQDKDGWSKVSTLVEPLMRTHEGVFEISPQWEDGLVRVRLTAFGKMLEEWL